MDKTVFTLDCLPIGKRGRILSLLHKGQHRRRLLDLGMIKGTVIEPLQKSPSGDPVAYFFRGTVIALRSEDAKKIVVCI